MARGWRRQEGTVGHPYSALNLRLVLATFGLVTMTALAVAAAVLGVRSVAIVAGVIAFVAAVNVVVVIRRRRQRKQREREAGHPDVKHSLFE